jgi:RNA polymerase sigma-70 factor (ECF subfamily)
VAREPWPGQRIEQEQTRELILKSMDDLDADMRAILVLRDVQDLDYQQLAEVLEIPIGTVKSRLFRARAALRHSIVVRGGV